MGAALKNKGHRNETPTRHSLPSSPPKRARLAKSWFPALGWSMFVGFGAMVAGVQGGIFSVPLVAAVLVLVLMMTPYLGFCFTSFHRDLRFWMSHWPRVWPLGLAAFFCGCYFLYAAATGAFDWLALGRIMAFVAVPTLLLYSAKRGQVGVWQDFAAVAAIWLPFNFGLVDMIWTWPEGEAAYVLNTPLAVDLALALFLGWRRLDVLRVRFTATKTELLFAAKMLLAFMAIGVPLGLATGFLTINPRFNWLMLIGKPLAIFFFIAVPEELLFRGLLQNLLVIRLGRPLVALGITSLLFGFSHWHTPGLPDFRYLSLAAVAGAFYGFTYIRSKSILVPALLHTAVDALWELLLHT